MPEHETPARHHENEPETPVPVGRGWRSSRLVAVAVIVATLLGTGILAAVAQSISERQQRSLLAERVGELSAVLESYTAQVRTVLRSAGSVAVADPDAKLFATIVDDWTATTAEAVVAQRQGVAFVTIARSGIGTSELGAPVPVEVVEVARRALASDDMVSGFYDVGEAGRLVLALAVPGTPDAIAYLNIPVIGMTEAPTDPDSPYRELNASLYAADSPDPDKVFLVSGGTPSEDDKVSQEIAVGSETWLLDISAREPLVGTLAASFPWLVLGIGIVFALVLGLLVETLVRRRAYALRLVEERTRSLQEARLAAEKANKAKSEFLSRMSHELRTPLNAVLGFGQLLEIDDLTPDQADSVNQITKGGAHLLDLINEILEISQIEAGHLSMSPEAVQVSEVVEAAVSLLRPLADERSVHLIGGSDGGCNHYIFADRQRLKQILLNLVGNGIKYNRQGGSVSISCFEPTPGTLRIQVTDTGPGIPADKFDLLFEPFERLGAEQTSVPGTGVGLALARGLAEAMGGTLGVESTPGRGSTFWIEFPIVESPVRIFEEANQASVPAPVRDTLTVLHIEDNPANVELVERVLAQRPAVTVVPAMQGRMGVDLARRYQPVLILLDLNLVDLPGAEVLKILRDDPVTANIPVAIVSADAMPRQVQRLLSSGAIAYLTKPIDIHRLLEIVDEAVAGVTGQPAAERA